MSNEKYDPDQQDQETESRKPESLSHLSYEELLQKVNEAEQAANQHWERILRMQADVENIQRRNERDVANAHKYAIDKFVSELLPIVDSLELCISTAPKNLPEAATSVIDGVQMTLKMFYTALEKFGVKQVNPVGQPFNPEFEQAISTQVDAKAKPGTVLSVLQKGYTLHNRLVRPALVVVSKAQE